MALKVKEIEFMGSYNRLDKMPKDRLIEIGFIGRSNVGKSSLINNLCQQRIAKTSSTPGKTQLLNFFKINRSFYLVDLPGYGYAKVAISIKREWERFIETYLQNRRQLKVVFLLLDIRRIPNDHDKMLCEWLKALAVSEGLVPVYVLTKCDKLTRGQINQSKLNIAKELFISPHDMIVHSSEKGIGRMEILTRIEELVDAFKKEEKTLRDKEQAELDEDEDYEEESNEEYGDEYDDAGDEK